MTQQATAPELLDAVRTIARAGDKHHGAHEWIAEWDGKRFFYGERHGQPDLPYAEVCALKYDPVHDPATPAVSIPKPGAITGTVLLYKATDKGEVVCFRSGKWIDAALAEADRIKSQPKQEKPLVIAANAELSSYNG